MYHLPPSPSTVSRMAAAQSLLILPVTPLLVLASVRMLTVPFIFDTAMLSYAEDFGLDTVSWAAFAFAASPDALPDWPLPLLPLPWPLPEPLLAEPVAVFDWADLFCISE